MAGVDAVIHLGALANDRPGSEDEVLSINVQGTWNILIACVEAEVGRVVYYSSVNSLGNFQGHRPSAYLPIDDAYPRHPMSPYQLSKHLSEEACKCYSARYGMVTVALRPMWVVARHHYEHWGGHDMERRMEWGRKDYWAYVDMRDVCDAGVRGLTVENVRHDAFLLAAGNTLIDIPTAELLDRFYPDTPWHGDRAEYFAQDPYRSLVDCAHAKEVLGWEPRHNWRTEVKAPSVASAV